MKIQCPHCMHWSRVTSSHKATDTARTGYAQCTNLACGHTFTITVTVGFTLSPSAQPNPRVVLPLSPTVTRQRLTDQLRMAPHADTDGIDVLACGLSGKDWYPDLFNQPDPHPSATPPS